MGRSAGVPPAVGPEKLSLSWAARSRGACVLYGSGVAGQSPLQCPINVVARPMLGCVVVATRERDASAAAGGTSALRDLSR